ncbi:AMP-binding protein [Solihabitans fulvus]|uniref:AMP-binding protein n=1 Tax=Solihabitans fulvus TaxID=1892852 RepID=A0A5B2XE16_9PSEU|nr:AMP-binding protein [Solihabitans fulvus]KAA2261201.1 AMP-binding protein [Solihabitans fulvus]
MAVTASTYWGLVEQRAARTPDDVLAVDEQDRTITFGALRDRAERVAAGLAERGVTGARPVSWQLPNRIEAIVLTTALARLGVVQNPIVVSGRAREVGFAVRQLGSRLLVTTSTWQGFDYAAMAHGIADTVPHLDVLVVDDELPQASPSPLPQAPTGDAVRWILYTSGTTADPKGARHTDASLLASGRNIADRLRMGAADRNAIVFPIAHIGGLSFLIGDLMTGASSILVERFGPAAVATLARQGVTLAGSGTPFNLVYLQVQEVAAAPIFPAVRAFPGGGATRPAWLHERMKRVFGGAGVVSGYGLTETGSLTMADVEDPDSVLAATEGRAYAGTDLRIVGQDGRLRDPGEEGEICARGPQVMQGYVDASLDTAFDADGYFHTGDLGVLDAAGNLRVSGRLKDVIIRKGENISARELEELLARHQSVADVAVVGLPDEETGERCCAVVVAATGQRPNLATLCEFLLDCGMARHKLPEQLELVDRLPKNSSGKTMKHVLRSDLAP